MLTFQLAIFVTVLFVVQKFLCWLTQKPLKYPPGPPSLPFIGNMAVFMTGRAPYHVLKELADQFGSVVSLKMGTGRFVVLSTVEAIREAFVRQSECFAGRPYMYSISLLTRNNCGIAFGDYTPIWKVHRKSCAVAIHRNVRGKNCTSSDVKILQEVEHLIVRLQQKTNQPTDISDDLNLAVLNVICDMTFGQRYEIHDSEYRAILDSANKFTAILQHGDPIDFIPALKIFPSKKLRLVQDVIKTRDAILQKKYEEHVATFDPKNIRDLTDAFLLSMLECTDENGNHELTEDHIVMAMFELFTGGFDSTFKTLKWAVIYLLHNPEVQKRIQDEMEQAIGSRLPTWDDHLKLPYLEATVLETLRSSSYSSLNGPRRTTTDTQLLGYDIPKDSIVVCNLWWVHHDPANWKDPDNFRPEHFINENGEVFQPKAFMAFSLGRRACLGDLLARMEIFLLLGGMLQRFNITAPEEDGLPALEPLPDLIRSPNEYRVVLKNR
ncbi:steroid 17-alpha-hydroxylase/17,20 lyase-like [Amphiura filiformis]|uniref:steroid 17-alpha-hydroxylase/17,20 lyase-like n=1 Tax=Amphiura filiformis TaxID=82378 RepID=UPI003B2227B7